MYVLLERVRAVVQLLQQSSCEERFSNGGWKPSLVELGLLLLGLPVPCFSLIHSSGGLDCYVLWSVQSVYELLCQLGSPKLDASKENIGANIAYESFADISKFIELVG